MSDTTPTSSPIRWFFGIFAGLAVFAVVGIYSSRMAYEGTGYDDEQAQLRLAKLDKLRASDQKTLTTADWIDQAKGTVRIPIDEAMSKEIAPLQAKPAAMGAALPAAAPAAPAASTNTASATNAPAAGTNAAPAAPSTTNAAPAAPATPAKNAPAPAPTKK